MSKTGKNAHLTDCETPTFLLDNHVCRLETPTFLLDKNHVRFQPQAGSFKKQPNKLAMVCVLHDHRLMSNRHCFAYLQII